MSANKKSTVGVSVKSSKKHSTENISSVATDNNIRKVVKHETDWYIPPTPKGGIPTYTAENDKYCPRGQMKKFNAMQKAVAEVHAEKGKTASDWIKSTLKSKFVDVPLTANLNFTTKAAAKAQHTPNSAMEIEIIQKIVVRENMLLDLHKLVENNSDVTACMSEVTELIKAVRWQTVEIIEDIRHWRSSLMSPMPFLFRGVNYLLKVATDFDFLDSYDEIIERYCFEFRYNPLAYRQGGDSQSYIVGPMTTLSTIITRKPPPPLTAFFNSKMSIDGIELFRLKNCEKDIQDEFDRVDNNAVNQHPTAQAPDFLTNNSSTGSLMGASAELRSLGSSASVAAPGYNQGSMVLDVSKSVNALAVGEHGMDTSKAGHLSRSPIDTGEGGNIQAGSTFGGDDCPPTNKKKLLTKRKKIKLRDEKK
jgi:hypothetical protein